MKMIFRLLLFFCLDLLLAFGSCTARAGQVRESQTDGIGLGTAGRNINNVLYYCHYNRKCVIDGMFEVNDVPNALFLPYGSSLLDQARKGSEWEQCINITTANDTIYFLESVEGYYYGYIWTSSEGIYVKQYKDLVDGHFWYEIEKKQPPIKQEVAQRISAWDVEWLTTKDERSPCGPKLHFVSRVIVRDHTIVSCQTIRIDIFWYQPRS